MTTSPEDASMQDLTDRFVTALETLHADRTPDPLVELFADDAQLSKLGESRDIDAGLSAREFWERYREIFDEIGSTFRHVVVGERVAALEWRSTGTLLDGSEIDYEGVSVLDGDETATLLVGFRTYYDAAVFRGDYDPAAYQGGVDERSSS
jgi:hypothetical protein